jgi:hypothetical protein
VQSPNAPTLEDAPKPFFIFDWLDEVKPDDLERARKMLQTSKKSSGSITEENDSEENVRKESFPAKTPSNSTTMSPKTGVSHFLQRSIAIGNGWNARGLQKAKKGAWSEALVCWENALEVRTQVLGEMHIDVANTCNNIGIALGKLDRFEEAVSTLTVLSTFERGTMERSIVKSRQRSTTLEMFFIKLATWRLPSSASAKPSFFKSTYSVPIMCRLQELALRWGTFTTRRKSTRTPGKLILMRSPFLSAPGFR